MQMPAWCGACDPQTRRFDLGDSERRCPHCHPYWAFGHGSIDPGHVPGTKAEQAQAVRWLSYELVGLRLLPLPELRRRLIPFFEAGWSPHDVVHALDFDPDGSRVRSVPSTADPPEMHRRAVLNMLSSWCDEQGAPLASASQRAEARRRKQLARQRATRADFAAVVSRSTGPAGAEASGCREIARQAAARGKQIRLEGRHRESSHLLSELARQEAQEAKVAKSLRQLGKWRFGILSNPDTAGPAPQSQAQAQGQGQGQARAQGQAQGSAQHPQDGNQSAAA
jgi:hypothetical protein